MQPEPRRREALRKARPTGPLLKAPLKVPPDQLPKAPLKVPPDHLPKVPLKVVPLKALLPTLRMQPLGWPKPPVGLKAKS